MLQIQARIGTQGKFKSVLRDIDNDIAVIKDFFEIDAIESFGNVPSTPKANSVRFRKISPKVRRRYPLVTWRGTLRCLENARQCSRSQKLISLLEVTAAIEDLKDQEDSINCPGKGISAGNGTKCNNNRCNLSDIEEWLVNKGKRASCSPNQYRSNSETTSTRCESNRHFRQSRRSPSTKNNLHSCQELHFTPDKANIRNTGLYILFVGLFCR